MAGPRHRRRLDPDAALVDLADVLADDDLVERLQRSVTSPGLPADGCPQLVAADGRPLERPRATGRHRARTSARPSRRIVTPEDPLLRDEVFALLAEWRADVNSVPMPQVPVIPPALQPVGRWRRWAAAANRAASPRSLRPALAISGALAGLLMGSAVVSAKEATPDQPLFALTTVFWPQDAASQYALVDVRTALNEASEALLADQPAEAVAAADRARQSLDDVDLDDRSTTLQRTVDDVRARATTLQSKTPHPTSTSAGSTSAAPTPTPAVRSTDDDAASTTRSSTATPRVSSTPAAQVAQQSPAAAVVPGSGVAAASTSGVAPTASGGGSPGNADRAGGSSGVNGSVTTTNSSTDGQTGSAGAGTSGAADPGAAGAGSGSAGSSSTSGAGQSTDPGATGSSGGSSSSVGVSAGSSTDGTVPQQGISPGGGTAGGASNGSGGSSAVPQIGSAAGASSSDGSVETPSLGGVATAASAAQPQSEAPPAPQPTPPPAAAADPPASSSGAVPSKSSSSEVNQVSSPGSTPAGTSVSGAGSKAR